MNERELRRYNMFGRVEIFGKDNAADFPEASTAATYFAQIGQVIEQLDEAKIAQMPNGITSKEVLMDSLILDLKNIIRTARAIAQDEPGFADKFRLPDRRFNSVLTAADSILAELKKPGVADLLSAHDIPREQIEQLRQDRQAIAAAQDAKESGKAISMANTVTVGRLIAEGMKLVTYLDAIVHNKYARNPEKLRAWKGASMVERIPRRFKADATTTSPPTASADA